MSTTPIDFTDRSRNGFGVGPAESLLLIARRAAVHRERRIGAVGGIIAIGMLSYLFWDNLRHFVYVWMTDENYSHGFLVPIISAYIANEAAKRGPLRIRSGVAVGVGMIAIAILGRLLTVLWPVGFVGDLSYLLGLAGICALILGTEALSRFAFPLFFLVFMVPLPIHLYTLIASPLQIFVSKLSAALLNLGGIPALQEGNLITLPGDRRLFVAEACSGMRQLTGFFALTTAWAYFAARPNWYRTLLVLSSAPIAMTANVIRVTLTGAITYHLDPKYASGSFHTIEGLLMIGVGYLMLRGGSDLLDRLLLIARQIREPVSENVERPQ